MINNNIKVINKKNKNYVQKKISNINGESTIPAVFIKYTKESDLEIITKKDFEDILELNTNLVREVSEIGFNYFLK